MRSKSGGCFCGAIRYNLSGPLEFASHCHCNSCRRASGAAMLSWTSVPSEHFQLRQGAERLGGHHSSVQVRWEFCSGCGTTLFYRSSETPGRVYLTVASLDDASEVVVESHVSFEEKAPWLDLSPELPRYRGKSDQPFS